MLMFELVYKLVRRVPVAARPACFAIGAETSAEPVLSSAGAAVASPSLPLSALQKALRAVLLVTRPGAVEIWQQDSHVSILSMNFSACE